MSATEVLTIGSVVKHRGEYSGSVTYYTNNQVTMYGCIFQALSNNFSGVAPLKVNSDGTIAFANTQIWKCIVDNVDLYNATLSTNSISARMSNVESNIDTIKTATESADTKATNAQTIAENAVNTISAMDAKIVPTILIADADTYWGADGAAMKETLTNGTKATRVNVKDAEGHMIGVMDVMADDSWHGITQVMLTRESATGLNNGLTEHSDEMAGLVMRSYGIAFEGDAKQYNGKWSGWKKVRDTAMKDDITELTDNLSAVKESVGAANGIAPLNNEGKIDSQYLDGGGTSIELVQELGTSTEDAMSQNAVTEALKRYALYGLNKEVSVKSGYRLNNYKEYAADGWYLTDFIPVTAGHKFHVVCGGSGYGTLHAGEFFKADKSTGVSGFSLYVYKNGNSEEVEVPEGAEYMRICSDCAYIEYTDLTTKTTTDGEVLMNAHYSTVDFEVLGTTLTSAGEETGTDDARWNCTSKIPMKKGEKFHIYTSNNQSGANGGFFLFGTDGVVVDSYFKSMSFPENFVAPYDGYFRIGMCALNTGLTLGFDITKFSSTLASAKKRINKTIHTRGHSFWVIDGHSYTKFDKKQTIRGFQTIFKEQFKFSDFDSIAYDGHSLGAQSTSDTSSIALKLTSWTGSEGDIWTLDTVTNDFKRNIPLGTIADYNSDSSTALTYYGALKIFANKISELSGDTAIVLVANASHRNNGGYTSTSKNTAGYGLSDYSNALMTIAELNGWYFVDVFNYSGITDDNIDITTYDGLHPTNLGFKLLATPWIAQLNMVYNKLL